MELGEYLAALRKGWVVIALLALLGGGGGYAQAAAKEPTYRSSSTVFVSLTRGETTSELVQGATYAQNLVESYVQLATMPVVLDQVIEELGLTTSARNLAGTVTADSPLDTVIIQISAVSRDPDLAAAIANSVAVHLASTAKELSPTAADGAAALEMTIVAQAQPSRDPFSPRPRVDAIAGFAAGLGLGVLLALGRAQLDTRVRTAKDLPRSPARSILGQIPHDRVLSRRPRAVLDDPHSPLAESYRRLRTNLQFLDASTPLRSLVVTSSVKGEGKSTTAVNLALVMAEAGSRVLLVDADLRSPSVADICGLEGSAGLSAILVRSAEPADVAQAWGVPGLHVITAGQIPPNPSQLLGSDRMVTFLEAAVEEYDLVIIDTAPLLAVTDAAVLARRTDGAIVVARSRKVRRPVLAEALASLDSAGALCLGLVVNSRPVPRSELRYGYGATPGRRSHRLRRRRHTQAAAMEPSVEPSAESHDDNPEPTDPHATDSPDRAPVGQHAHQHLGEPAPLGEAEAPLGPVPDDAPTLELTLEPAGPGDVEAGTGEPDHPQEAEQDEDDLAPREERLVAPRRRGATEGG